MKNNVPSPDTRPAASPEVPCWFTYASGRRCKGHIVRVEAFKANLTWTRRDDGSWTFGWGQPRSHYHCYCSEKGNHAGYGRPDSEQLKLYYDQLPKELCEIMSQT
jgi:hypothetical protein